jgi:hypothetical protein
MPSATSSTSSRHGPRAAACMQNRLLACFTFARALEAKGATSTWCYTY